MPVSLILDEDSGPLALDTIEAGSMESTAGAQQIGGTFELYSPAAQDLPS